MFFIALVIVVILMEVVLWFMDMREERLMSAQAGEDDNVVYPVFVELSELSAVETQDEAEMARIAA